MRSHPLRLESKNPGHTSRTNRSQSAHGKSSPADSRLTLEIQEPETVGQLTDEDRVAVFIRGGCDRAVAVGAGADRPMDSRNSRPIEDAVRPKRRIDMF